LQINASPSVARPIQTFIDIDADVRVDIVGEVKAVMAATAEPTVVVDAIAMSATKVRIAQALIDVDTVTVFRLKQQNHNL
jgi:hypothetical protein